LNPKDLMQGVLLGEPAVQRRAMAKSITLLESTLPSDRMLADELLTGLLPHSGKSFRLGISGVPGVGKSTFIEALGLFLIAQGHRVAVLAIDPSSTVSGGSILGDKTRMEHLSVHEKAYIRPSPSSGTLGGVAEKNARSHVGMRSRRLRRGHCGNCGRGSKRNRRGQHDRHVCAHATAQMQVTICKPFKKGVMELADLVVINKADIDASAATRAEAQITSALRLLGMHGHPDHAHFDEEIWHPEVIQISALFKPRRRQLLAPCFEVQTFATCQAKV
jgi:LAO/AO transport system kinase